MAGQQEIFQQKMNLGHSAAWDQMWDRAAEYYRQALDEFPDHPQALTNLGLAQIELQDYQAALNYYEKAARVMPTDPLPLEKIAQLYERLGNLDRTIIASLRAAELYLTTKDVQKAIHNWERIIRLKPANLQARSRLALINERMGRKQLAVKEYLAVASILQSAGELDKAQMAINHALALEPQSEEAKNALSLLKDFKPLPEPPRPPGGLAPLRMAQVRQLNTSEQSSQPVESNEHPVEAACQRALTILADMLFEMPEEASPVKRQGLQAIVAGAGLGSKSLDKTRLAMHLSQVIDSQTRGDLSQAAEELARAMEAGLEHTAADYDLGYLLYHSAKAESGVRYLQRAIKSQDFNLAARLLLGEFAHQRQDTKQAAGHYLEALRIADTQVVAPENSVELRQLYDPIIETLIRKDPQVLNALCENIHHMLMHADWKSRLSQARNQLLDGQNGVIRPVVEILTESHSSQLMDALAQIKAFRKQGYMNSAMDQAFNSLDLAPTYLPLHRLMGEMLVEQGNIPAAVSKYQTVAKSYSSMGDTQQAIAMYRNILELAPTDLQVRNRLISQLISAGQKEEAVQEHMHLADVYYRQADYNTSRRIYTDALRVAHQTHVDRSLRVKILHRMADIDMQSLDWRQALRVFEQIRSLQPDDTKARFRLVEINLRLNQEKQALSELDQYLEHLLEIHKEQEAVDFLESFAKENPQLVSIRRRLADLYRQLGRKEQAVSQLDAIGELLLEGGDRAGAIQIIDTLLGLEPDNKGAYENLLAQLRGRSA